MSRDRAVFGGGLVALTDLYISTKRYKDAAEQLIKLKQLNDDAQIVRKLVLLQLQQGKFEDALANLLAIKEMTVEDSYYLRDNLYEARQARGRAGHAFGRSLSPAGWDARP